MDASRGKQPMIAKPHHLHVEHYNHHRDHFRPDSQPMKTQYVAKPVPSTVEQPVKRRRGRPRKYPRPEDAVQPQSSASVFSNPNEISLDRKCPTGKIRLFFQDQPPMAHKLFNQRSRDRNAPHNYYHAPVSSVTSATESSIDYHGKAQDNGVQYQLVKDESRDLSTHARPPNREYQQPARDRYHHEPFPPVKQEPYDKQEPYQDIAGKEFIGLHIRKEFAGFGWFNGVIQNCRMTAEMEEVFRIVYTDGDDEDMFRHEIVRYLVPNSERNQLSYGIDSRRVGGVDSRHYSNVVDERLVPRTQYEYHHQPTPAAAQLTPKPPQRLPVPVPVHDNLFQLAARKIGIYSPESRRKRIQRFWDKKKSRVWKKKIRYSCRAELADERFRHKGRFVSKALIETYTSKGLSLKEALETIDRKLADSREAQKKKRTERKAEAKNVANTANKVNIRTSGTGSSSNGSDSGGY